MLCQDEAKKLKSDQKRFIVSFSWHIFLVCFVLWQEIQWQQMHLPPNILLMEQTLILKYLRGIYAAWGEVAPAIILFAGFFMALHEDRLD